MDAIVLHPSLLSVYLDNCFRIDVECCYVLQMLISRRVAFEEIGFPCNNLVLNGCAQLPDYIATNPPLKEHLLQKNQLDDDDAIRIAEALSMNTNLRTLNVNENHITCIGYDAIRKALFDTTNFNSVTASNHTCWIYYDDNIMDCPHNNGYHDGSQEDPKTNLATKIYSVLSSRNKAGTNARTLDLELGEECLSLVPKILEVVHKASSLGYRQHYLIWEPKNCGMSKDEAMKPLSIVYELVRSWKMPSLFEYHYRG